MHSRLKISTDQLDQHASEIVTRDARKSSGEFADNGEDIPVFCAGGCGEVMGYVGKGDSIPTRWCSACESVRAPESASMDQPVSTKAVPLNTDELAALRSAPRDLRKAHVVQVLAVALIFAGSIYIALGEPIGIYLAAVGTLAWIAVGLVLWRLKN